MTRYYKKCVRGFYENIPHPLKIEICFAWCNQVPTHTQLRMSLLEPVLALSQANEKALQYELASVKKELAKSQANEQILYEVALGHVQNIKNLIKCIMKKKRRIKKMVV